MTPEFIDITVTADDEEVIVILQGHVTLLNYEDASFLRDALIDQLGGYEYETTGE